MLYLPMPFVIPRLNNSIFEALSMTKKELKEFRGFDLLESEKVKRLLCSCTKSQRRIGWCELRKRFFDFHFFSTFPANVQTRSFPMIPKYASVATSERVKIFCMSLDWHKLNFHCIAPRSRRTIEEDREESSSHLRDKKRQRAKRQNENSQFLHPFCSSELCF